LLNTLHGDNDDLRFGDHLVMSQLLQKGVAVHLGHEQVQENYIGLLRPGDPQAFLATEGFQHAYMLIDRFQHACEETHDMGVIVHNQHRTWRSRQPRKRM